MADAAITESSEVELEAKRKADGSWHPCQVSLCSGGGLSVKYEGQDSEDIILDVEDALSCLRLRSAPLQGDDCCYIEEGKYVLAAFEKNSQRLFFDAVVQKAIRVRHSKRSPCRCTFMIKCHFEHDENKISSIPSSSILKLATESIESHPVVAAFLNSVEKPYLSASSSPSLFDDNEDEIDLHELMKQIEGISCISSLTDKSKKGFLKDTLLGVDHGGRNDQTPTKLVASEQVSKRVQVSCGRSHLRRSARRENKPQPIVEDLKPSEPSFIEKSEQNQSPLSPLAARAAVASLVSKLPQKIESIVHKERNCVSVLDSSTSVGVLGGSCTNIVNKVDSFVINERGASGKKLHPQKSNGTLLMNVCNTFEPSIDKDSSLSSSIRNEESTLPVVASRLTRSVMKRESATKNRDDETTTAAENATFVRVTRTAVLKENGNLAKTVTEKSQDKKVRATRSTCSDLIMETEVSVIEDKSRTLDEGKKCNILRSTARVTRAAARAGTRNSDDRAKGPLKAKTDSKRSQSDNSDSDCEATVSAKKRALSLIYDELKFGESIKKQKGLNAVERIRNETDLHGNVHAKSIKKPNSSQNQRSRA